MRKLVFVSLVLLAGSVPGESANWIAGFRTTPSESDYKAFFADSPAPVLTRTFEAGKVARAVWRIAAPGLCDAFVNGHRVTATTLTPWTDYSCRVLERAYDVTSFLKEGTNELRLELGNGWWNPLPMLMWGVENLRIDMAHGDPCVKATLELVGTDGSSVSVPTDASWSAADGRVRFNNIYLGERFDARCADGERKPVRLVKGPLGKVLPADIPETVVFRSWPATRVFSPRRGVWVVDFGENLAGNVRMTFRGLAAGAKVTATYGECLNPDLTVNVMTTVAGQMKNPKVDPPGIAAQRDVYVAGGEPVETYEPRFTFHGFRYLELEGLPAAPDPADFTALAYSADVRETASFVCSDERVNRLRDVCRRTFRANLRSVQSDCPGRERFCYGGDVSASAESFILNYDMSKVYRKILRDRLDAAERCGGFFPYLSPVLCLEFSRTYRDFGFTIDVPVLTDLLIRYYGDTEILNETYPAMVRFLDVCERDFTPENVPPDAFGDHEALEKTDLRVSALCHYHLFLKLTARFAWRLGRPDDSARFERMALALEKEFQKMTAYVPNPGYVGHGRQSDQVFALYHGMLRPDERPGAYDLLRKDVLAHGCALSTGFFSTRYVLEVLTDGGDAELAGRLLTHEGFPGWFHMIDRGATTLWETWAETDNIYSQNHPMFGSCAAGMMRGILGIRVCDDAVGCDKVEIRPHAVAGITAAAGHLDTPQGRISVSWRLENGKMVVEKTVPKGVTVR